MEELTRRVDLVEESCRRLERQNCWLKLAVVVLPLVALIAGAASQNQHLTADSVTAQRFVVRSEDGKTRATFQADARETSLRLLADDEKPALVLRLSHNQAGQEIVSLNQFYPTGKPGFGFVTTPDGVASFALRRPDGKLLIALNSKATDSLPDVELGDGRQKIRLPGNK
jgi:hypothetical protein